MAFSVEENNIAKTGKLLGQKNAIFHSKQFKIGNCSSKNVT